MARSNREVAGRRSSGRRSATRVQEFFGASASPRRSERIGQGFFQADPVLGREFIGFLASCSVPCGRPRRHDWTSSRREQRRSTRSPTSDGLRPASQGRLPACPADSGQVGQGDPARQLLGLFVPRPSGAGPRLIELARPDGNLGAEDGEVGGVGHHLRGVIQGLVDLGQCCGRSFSGRRRFCADDSRQPSSEPGRGELTSQPSGPRRSSVFRDRLVIPAQCVRRRDPPGVRPSGDPGSTARSRWHATSCAVGVPLTFVVLGEQEVGPLDQLVRIRSWTPSGPGPFLGSVSPRPDHPRRSSRRASR